MNEAILQAIDVKKSFLHGSTKIEVLKGVTFSLQAGERVAVVGASGVGKSTLLHIVGTLDQLTSGKVLIQGKEVSGLKEWELSKIRNELIGFVFQFHHLLPELSAIENVILPGMIKGEAVSTLNNRANSLLNDVGLAHRLNHKPGELSGGEQQRVALARALIMKPKLLLCDEITGNLDQETGWKMFELLQKIASENKTSILFVTHDSELAGEFEKRFNLIGGVLAN